MRVPWQDRRAASAGTAWRRRVEEADNDFANDEDYENIALEAMEPGLQPGQAADRRREFAVDRTSPIRGRRKSPERTIRPARCCNG